MYTRVSGTLFCLLSVVFLAPPAAHAQLFTSESTAEIRLSPEYPTDNQTVTATLFAPGVDLSTARIAWLINGKVVPNENKPTFTFTTPSLGKTISIGALIEPINQEAIAAEISIHPTRVTLLWEGDTYTPAWYKGRALYTVGSRVRLHALAEIVSPNGTYLDSDSLVYIWKRNGVRLSDLSGIGKKTAIIDGSQFLSDDIIEVVVQSNDGKYSGSSAIRITPQKPQLRVYVFDPLLGIMNYVSADTLTSINGTTDNTFLQIEPFHADVTHPNDPNARYTWTLNNERATPLANTPSRIALASDVRTAVKVPLSVAFKHRQYPLQQVQQTFSLFLEENVSGAFFGL